MMRKMMALLCLMLLFALGAQAQPAAASPIRDSAAVLSADTLSDAAKLSNLVKSATGIRLMVEMRHFLGGADVQITADKLLKELPNSADTLLLLAAVGEETYAVAAGAQASALLNKDARDILLSRQFREPFRARNYDLAVAAYLREAADQLARISGKSVSTGGVFGQAFATQRPETDIYKSITITSPESGSRATQNPGAVRQKAEQQEKGMSWFSIIAIGFVLSIVFGNKEKRRGCGCGPLGWIFGTFGIAKLFGWRR